MRTILAANDRKPSNSSGSKGLVVCHGPQRQQWGSAANLRQASLFTFCLSMSLFFCLSSLPHSFNWLALLTWNKKVAVAWSYLSCSFIVLVPWEEMDSTCFQLLNTWQRTLRSPAWIKCSLWKQSAGLDRFWEVIGPDHLPLDQLTLLI